jgi:predicted Zn-dependent protease
MIRAVSLLALAAAVAAAAPWSEAASGCDAAPYECAVSYVERQEFAAAIRLLEPLAREQPRNLKVLNLLGIALTGSGKTELANTRFREAMRVDPTFYPSIKNLAINELDSGRRKEAQRLFEMVLEHAPKDDVAHVNLAEIHHAAGRMRSALVHYEKSRTRVLTNPVWTVHYGEALLAQKRKGAALATFDRLPRGDAEAMFAAGSALGKAGEHLEAARFFAAARSGFKDPYAAGFNQALMLVEAGAHAEAIAAVDEMFARDFKTGELYNLLSRAYYGTGRIKDAYDALREATRLEPGNEENYVDLAMICLDLENHDLGLEIVGIGLEHRPNSYILYLQRGVLLAMKAQLTDAEQAFESARRLAPERPAAHAALAMVWMQTGQTEKAVATLRTETRARADHVVPYTFAVALVRSGVDPASDAAVEAIDALRASIRANDRFAPAHSQLGRLLLKRGEVDEAIRELEKAVALDPGATAALYNLGQAYSKKGDRVRAAELLARVSKLNAQERGDDPDGELKRTVVRIVKEGATKPGGTP